MPLSQTNHAAFVSLGSNSGNRLAYLQTALERLQQEANLSVCCCSSVYETSPWGDSPPQPAYLNAVIGLQTTLSPLVFLSLLQQIEANNGRKRTVRWGERTLDLDILFMDDLVWEEEHLTIPHPRLHERKFVLVPLQEIAPHWVHPFFHKEIVELSRSCIDSSIVVKTDYSLYKI